MIAVRPNELRTVTQAVAKRTGDRFCGTVEALNEVTSVVDSETAGAETLDGAVFDAFGLESESTWSIE